MTFRLGDRSLFPTLTTPIYTDHAAVGPMPTPVLDAGKSVLDVFASGGTAAFPDILPHNDAARAGVAGLIGAKAEDVALLGNTSQGVTATALCLDWSPGDRVLVFEGEFPANITPWQRAAEHFGLELVWVPLAAFADDPAEGLERVEAELRRGVRLVAVSAVQFQTGLLMPLTEMGRLCSTHGAELFVDAIQAVGAVPIDVGAMGIDYLAAGGHKWLMASLGTGFLWSRRWSAMKPRMASWLSHEEALGFLSEGAGLLRYDRGIPPGPSMVEGGGWNAAGRAMLATSTALLGELGVEAIHGHVQRWIDRLEAGLLERGWTSLRDARGRSCILSVDPPGDPLGLAERLRGRGIALSTPDGHLRFAPHWPNSIDEVGRILEAVDAEG